MNRSARPEVTGRGTGHNDGAPHERVVGPLPPLPDGFVLPFVFGPIKKACAFLGIDDNRLYEQLEPLDPDILIQIGGRTLIDIPRTMMLIAAMPRGKRAPPKVGPKKGERRRVGRRGKSEPPSPEQSELNDD
jgi:hypothetical protein